MYNRGSPSCEIENVLHRKRSENMIDDKEKIRIENFLKLDRKSQDRLEYFDGKIIPLSLPTAEHQRILFNFAVELKDYCKEKPYKAYVSLNTWLEREKEIAKIRVQPDIIIISDKTGLKENEYRGIPDLIIEVLNPYNQSHDRIRKYDVYMRFGVKEYWIVNPQLKTMEVYVLKGQEYKQVAIYKGKDTAESYIFNEIKIDLKNVF